MARHQGNIQPVDLGAVGVGLLQEGDLLGEELYSSSSTSGGLPAASAGEASGPAVIWESKLAMGAWGSPVAGSIAAGSKVTGTT